MDDEELFIVNKSKSRSIHIRKALYATLTNGIGFDLFSLIAAELGHKTNFSSTFYNLQSKLLIQSLDLAAKSCLQCYEANKARIVSIDGAWSCPRSASFCIVDLIDVDTGKMIDFQIVTSLILKGVEHNHLIHSVTDHPRNFESIGTRSIATRNPLLNAQVFVHDKDVRMKELLINEL